MQSAVLTSRHLRREFDPGQVRPPVLFRARRAGSDGAELARRVAGAPDSCGELWLRPDDGHVSVLDAAEAALGWLWEHARQG